MAITLGGRRLLFFNRLAVSLPCPSESCFSCGWRCILGPSCRIGLLLLLLLPLGENRCQRAAALPLLRHLLHQREPLFLIGRWADLVWLNVPFHGASTPTWLLSLLLLKVGAQANQVLLNALLLHDLLIVLELGLDSVRICPDS